MFKKFLLFVIFQPCFLIKAYNVLRPYNSVIRLWDLKPINNADYGILYLLLNDKDISTATFSRVVKECVDQGAIQGSAADIFKSFKLIIQGDTYYYISKTLPASKALANFAADEEKNACRFIISSYGRDVLCKYYPEKTNRYKIQVTLDQLAIFALSIFILKHTVTFSEITATTKLVAQSTASYAANTASYAAKKIIYPYCYYTGKAVVASFYYNPVWYGPSVLFKKIFCK